MAVQAVIVDVSKSVKPIQAGRSGKDYLGKSFQKMQSQLKGLNERKNNSNLAGKDFLSNAIGKLSKVISKFVSFTSSFGSGIGLEKMIQKLFEKVMRTAGGNSNAFFRLFQKIGDAITLSIKNGIEKSDIAGMIIRNMPRSKINLSGFQGGKTEFKMPSVAQGKTGVLSNIFKKDIPKFTENFKTRLAAFPKLAEGFKDMPKFAAAFKGVSAVAGVAGSVISGLLIAAKLIGTIIKGTVNFVKKMMGKIKEGVSKWIISPIIQTQNQISENKGYQYLLTKDEEVQGLGKEEAQKVREKNAYEFDNAVFKMSEKSPFSHESIDSGARLFLNNGLDRDETLKRLAIIQDTAAAQSMDDSGFENLVNGISQLSARDTIYIEDITKGLGDTIPALRLITEGINKEAGATKKSMEEIRKAIENGDIKGSEAIEALLRGMEVYAGTAEEIASSTFMGLKTKITNLFKSTILKNWGKGLSDGFTTGFSKIASWMDQHRDTFEKWGESLRKIGEQVGTAVSNVLGGIMERFNEVVNSDNFETLDLSEKIVVLWDKVIKEDFFNWWNGDGKAFFVKISHEAGKLVGEIFTGALCAMMGSSFEGSLVGDGFLMGASFIDGFKNGINGSLLVETLQDLVSKIVVAPFNALQDLWDQFCVYIKKQKDQPLDVQPYYANTYENEDVPEVVKKAIHKGSFGEKPIIPINFGDGQPKTEIDDNTKKSIGVMSTSYEEKKESMLEIEGKYIKEKNKQNLIKELYEEVNSIDIKNSSDIDKFMNSMKEVFEHKNFISFQDAKAFLEGEEGKKEVEKNKKNVETEKINFENELEKMENGFTWALEQEKAVEPEYNWKQNQADLYKQNEGSFLEMVDKIENANKILADTKSSIGEKQQYTEIKENTREALYRRLASYGVGEEEIIKTGGDPTKLRDLIKESGTEFGNNVEEIGEIYNKLQEIIKNYREMKLFSLKKNIEEETNMDFDTFLATAQNNTGSVSESAEKVLQQIYQLEEATEKFVQPSSKDIIIKIISIHEKKIYEKDEHGNIKEPSYHKKPSNSEIGKTTTEETEDSLSSDFIGANAKGGILTSPQISLVAEAGPEAIIPLSGVYKERGISLWEQAGKLLGIYPHAKGGIFGSFTMPRKKSYLYQQMEENEDMKETKEAMETPAKIDIGGVQLGGINFTFQGTEANSREGIMTVIKEQMPNIADEIAATIAINIQKVFANMKKQTA